VIELKDVSFGYNGKEIFSGLNLYIGSGEKVVLVGVNGSGKSTLLKILDALLFPHRGSYTFKGNPVSRKSLKNRDFHRNFRKSVALLFQNSDVMLFNPTVYDEIAFAPRQLGMDSIDERVKYWAKVCGVEKFLNLPPFNLSGGEKRRVCIASLLICEPELLLLDEPAASLDPPSIGWLVELLDGIKATTITATHNLSLASELGERCIVISPEHSVVADGGIDSILRDMDILKRAKLVHAHRHRHGKMVHSHLHMHDWD